MLCRSVPLLQEVGTGIFGQMMRFLASRSGSASQISRELVSTQNLSTNIASAARNLVSSRFNGGFIAKPHGPTLGGLSIFMNSVKHNCRSFTHSRSLRSSEGPGNSSAVSSSSPSTNGFVRWYLEMIDKYPILTKSITASAIYTSADLTSQVITFASSDVSAVSDKLEFDKLRTLRMAGYGLILSGPTLHLWFNFLSKTIPKRDLISTAKKMVLGQTVYGPAITAVFFSGNAYMQGESGSEIFARLKRDLVPTFKSGLMFWPLCDFITYRYVPVHLQPLVSNSFAFIWTVYLTYMASLKKVNIEEQLVS